MTASQNLNEPRRDDAAIPLKEATMSNIASANPSYHARILRRKQIEEVFGISRSTIYARLDPKSKQHDPAFPHPIKLSAKSVGWLQSECEAYIAHLVAISRAPA